MNRYWAYWNRGWWAWLLVLCLNLVTGLIALPLALAFRKDPVLYLVSVAAFWLVVGAPLWGWMFERFAAGSDRLAPPDERPQAVPGTREESGEWDGH